MDLMSALYNNGNTAETSAFNNEGGHQQNGNDGGYRQNGNEGGYRRNEGWNKGNEGRY